MSSKVTLIFQLTTSPVDLTLAIPHTGGWTESYWQGANIPSTFPAIAALVNARAALLPQGAAIVGVRVGLYTLAENKFIPNGASTGPVFAPGVQNNSSDVPQMALLCGSTSNEGPNQAKFVLRGIPDGMVQGGEYRPDTAFKGAVTRFFNALTSGGWEFLGRVLANPTVRLYSIQASLTAGHVKLQGDPSIYSINKYVRLLRVRDNDGLPIKGAYQMTSTYVDGSGFDIAVKDDTIRSTTGGFMRLDQIGLFAFTQPTFKRVSVRKVGRPYESYRGRASKRR